MECPNVYQPKLDANGRFWKGVQLTCLQAFSQVHWHSGKSQWYSPTCKLHTFQAVLREALSREEGILELTDTMKRGPEDRQDVLYAFSIDPALKYQLTPGEREFLKKLDLEDFLTSNSWGVLHSPLVTEAIAALEPDTFWTTVKGEKVRLIAEDWREQFKHTFQLTKKEAQPVTRQWKVTELFPTLKENPEKDTVHISDCQHPGARRPLRLLSSIFCLNPTHQNSITLAFVEMVVAALNGQGADWPQEFYHEITEELTTLHNKHLATRVKVEKTSVGPHLTLILKAGGVLNIREELEAGYRSERALTLEEQRPVPKKPKTVDAKESPETQTVIRQRPARQKEATTKREPRKAAQVYSVAVQPADTSSKAPEKKVILETTERRQLPNPLPAMVEQIGQAHRRLENLLSSFTSKAPQGLINRMNDEFFKIQRESILKESLGKATDTGSEVLLKSQKVQLQHLAQRLDNTDSLNDINTETIFRLEEELATFRTKWEQAKEEIVSLKGQKDEALEQLSKLQTTTEKHAELEAKLTNAEELIDLYVEHSFETLLADQEEEVAGLRAEIHTGTHQNQQELTTLRDKLEFAEEETRGLRGQNAETLGKFTKLQQVIDDQAQQLQGKDAEISRLNDYIAEMRDMLKRSDGLDDRRKSDITRLESKVADYQQEIQQLNKDKHKLIAQISAGEGKTHLLSTRSNLEHERSSPHPIMNKEKHTLASGVASKLLNELRRDLARTQQENADLAQRLHKQQDESGESTIPHTAIHPRTEIVQQFLKHTEPLDSLMQYHRVYGGLNLLLSNIPLLKTGCKLEFAQMKEIWSQANAAARDTLVFMWCLGEIKTPLGVIEMLTASPPFYVKRYILRCVKLWAQHRNITRVPRESLPILKSYSHGQFHLIRRMQRDYTKEFNQALLTLAAEDTAICFEAVQQHQAVTIQHPTIQPNLSQVKDFVNATLEAQQTAISHKYFGALNSGTLLFQPRYHVSNQQMSPKSMGTCFL